MLWDINTYIRTHFFLDTLLLGNCTFWFFDSTTSAPKFKYIKLCVPWNSLPDNKSPSRRVQHTVILNQLQIDDGAVDVVLGISHKLDILYFKELYYIIPLVYDYMKTKQKVSVHLQLHIVRYIKTWNGFFFFF